MPEYFFYCKFKTKKEGWKHVTARHASMSSIPKYIKCEKCGQRATLGLAPSRLLTGAVKNAPLDRKQRELYAHVFGKKKAAKMQTTGDVEKNLRDFACRYPHLMPGYVRGRSYDLNSASDIKDLGLPGDRVSDPFPDTPITEDNRTNTNQWSRR